jgi:hypothetical protein
MRIPHRGKGKTYAPIFMCKNHPRTRGSTIAKRVFVMLEATDRESMKTAAKNEAKMEVPEGTKQEWQRLGVYRRLSDNSADLVHGRCCQLQAWRLHLHTRPNMLKRSQRRRFMLGCGGTVSYSMFYSAQMLM